MSAEQYANQLRALLPRGEAWRAERGSLMDSLLLAIATEFARIDARGGDLLNEADPRTTVELLEDWERVLGLPNPCITEEQTNAQRRAAVVEKVRRLGGQSVAYFLQVAESLGYDITITEFRPFVAGSDAGDPLTNGDWIFTWQVNGPEVTTTDFKVGVSAVGEPLRTWGNEELECVINQLKPAHTHVLFAYAESE